MTLDEYFGDWMKVIDRTELESVMSKVRLEYKRRLLCPAQSDVFRAFKLCSLKEVQIGDTLIKVLKTVDPFSGENTAVQYIVVTKDTIPKLLEDGIIYYQACRICYN